MSEERATYTTEASATGPEGALRPLARWLGRLTVPQGRGTLWYYFGWFTLFLLAVMIGTGILLSVYYEPSVAPATTIDGKPVLAARVKAGTKLDHYPPGTILPIPYDPASGELLVGPALRDGLDVLRDTTTGEPIRPSTAWASVEGRIMREVSFGPFIRSLHVYAASMLFASLFIHLFSTLLMGAYRRPRRATWITGLFLLLLVAGSGFTGSVLPWNTLAVSAASVASGAAEWGLPLAGTWTAEMIRGGAGVAAPTLTRMFTLHAIVLPMGIIALTALHLLLVHATGLSRTGRPRRELASSAAIATASAIALVAVPLATGSFDPLSPWITLPLTLLPVSLAHLLSTSLAGSLRDAMAPPGAARTSRQHRDALPFYGAQIYRDLVGWAFALGILATLAAAAPHAAGAIAGFPIDLTKPLVSSGAVHPEWYLLIPYRLLSFLPGGMALAALFLIFLVLFLIPAIDPTGRRRRIAQALGLLLLATVVALTI